MKATRAMPGVQVTSGDWECPKCHSKDIGLARATKKGAKLECRACGHRGSPMQF